MNRIYLNDASLTEIESTILNTMGDESGTLIEVEDCIFHPKGGGQPDDFGWVIYEEIEYPVLGFKKIGKDLLLATKDGGELMNKLWSGDKVLLRLDMARRSKAMRLHSAAHVIMASARRRLADYSPSGMAIDDDLNKAVVRYRTVVPVADEFNHDLSSAVDEVIKSNLKISSHDFKSIDHAKAEGGELFRMDPALQLKGAVRIIEIEGLDFNPCGGTHVTTTSEIGSVKLISTFQTDGMAQTMFTLND